MGIQKLTVMCMEMMMKKSKSLRKVIVYKTMNRRISSIIKDLESKKENFYFKSGSQYSNWTVTELKAQMAINSNRILFIRSKMLEVKRGT